MQISDLHVEVLARLLRERVGFDVRAEGYNFLRTALADRMRESLEGDVGRYLRSLAEDEGELERLLPLVTIGKTAFFRDAGQFRALKSLLPSLLDEARVEGRRLSIWSTACASGEEAYSIAISLLEAGATPTEVELLATDINPRAIAAAARGRYDERQVEPVSEERLSRFFVRHEGEYAVGAELRAMVDAFRTHNIHKTAMPLPESGAWDIVFCRNVLIYFDREGIRAVAARIFEHLRPGGWLLLGYSESLFKLFEGFQLVELEGAFLYRRPLAVPVAAPASEVPALPDPVALPRLRARKPPQPSPAPSPKRTPKDPLPRAIARIQEGDFVEAARLLEGALEREPRRLTLRLTLGNVLALLRRTEEAEARFEEALEDAPLHPETLLFRGLFLLERARYEEAEQSLARVLYWEPDFALAHYLLGRCQEKRKRPEQARRSYRNALRALAATQPRLGAFYPDLPQEAEALGAAARLALSSL